MTREGMESWTDPQVEVAGISVADATRREVVDWIARPNNSPGPRLVYALHIGGLVRAREDSAFGSILNAADLVYADGASVVLLAKRRGAKHIQRAATTDIGFDVLRAWTSAHLPAVALIGGPIGLAEEAGRAMERAGVARVVSTSHGYEQDWPTVLAELRTSEPDLIFVGMGVPREMEWCDRYRSDLPNAVVLTCGGWFGFLANDEVRAPLLLQRIGLEWAWRLAQSPRRLAKRYAKGSLVVISELVKPGNQPTRDVGTSRS